MTDTALFNPLSVELNSDGLIIGGYYHDSNIQSLDFEQESEMKIIYSRTDGLNSALILKGIEAGNIHLKANDIITEIFYWNKAQLVELHDGVWKEILQNFDLDECKDTVLGSVGISHGLLQIYCATGGSASVIISDFCFGHLAKLN